MLSGQGSSGHGCLHQHQHEKTTYTKSSSIKVCKDKSFPMISTTNSLFSLVIFTELAYSVAPGPW